LRFVPPLSYISLSDHVNKQNEQRNKRKEEIAQATSWRLQFFEKVEDDEICKYYMNMWCGTDGFENRFGIGQEVWILTRNGGEL
jgi:hypothetical protein